MEIHSFKAENIGEWIGLFSGYIEAHVAISNEGNNIANSLIYNNDNTNN